MKSSISCVIALYEGLGFKRGSYGVARRGNDEKTEVNGEMVGSWGVNKDGQTWTVTHIPSGMAACRVASLAQGKAFIEAMVEKEPSLLHAATEADIMKHRDLIVGLIKNKPIVDKASKGAANRVANKAINVAAILKDGGLYNLGDRSGKAGVMYGIPESARRIALGKREIMRNTFRVYIRDEYMFKRPQVSWVMDDSELISGIDEKKLAAWIKWAKEGRSTKEVLAAARAKWNEIPPSEQDPYVLEKG